MKKLKQDTSIGIPVPVRGNAWMAMIGNKLRISPSMYNVFKDMSQGVNYTPLVEEDIPRTFPHLNDLFEEIDFRIISSIHG